LNAVKEFVCATGSRCERVVANVTRGTAEVAGSPWPGRTTAACQSSSKWTEGRNSPHSLLIEFIYSSLSVRGKRILQSGGERLIEGLPTLGFILGSQM
jgi:hypothetical protein